MMVIHAASAGLPQLTNAFALLRLLPINDQPKDAEILVLRHGSRSWNANWAEPGRSSPPLIGRSSRRCYTDSHRTCFVGSSC